MQTSFVHLNLHSEYSLVDSTIAIDALVNCAASLDMPALALTDQNNFFGQVKCYKALERKGIKPIIGVDLSYQDPVSGQLCQAILICMNQTGYRSLSRLISRAYLEGQRAGEPLVQQSWIVESSAGLLVLLGSESDVAKAISDNNQSRATDSLKDWLYAFGDRLYLEVQRTGRQHDDVWLSASLDLAQSHNVPLVATNAVRFLYAEDFEAHEARVCIQEGRTLGDPRRPRRYSAQQYFRSAQEMAELFADLPEAIHNSALIAQRCTVQIDLGHYQLPEFPVPAQHTPESWLRQESERGLQLRLQTLLAFAPEKNSQHYLQRLEAELAVIAEMGFAGYFLIVADFIRWAKTQEIPVGPGRGSGAGSLVAYALGITDLDPLEYDLLFERFLNPERVSLPDFDVDFCKARRDEVIAYVTQRYGRDRVSQIITHGTMAARAVVRDVGRVLGFAYAFTDSLAKLIPFELNITLDRALAEEPILKDRYERDDDVRHLFDLARKLEGLARNAGKHAGGIVIAPKPLTEYMPLYCEQGAEGVVSQFDMGDVEAVGLVKFDFLGLQTLTIIDWAVRDINRQRTAQGEDVLDIARLPLNDQPSFDLIRRAETTAVFQLESRGMRELVKRLQPDSFDDLIALVALFRPGPLQSGMVDDFIERKHGRSLIRYMHPSLETILKPTYGVIVYQEQVMQIAQSLAGYTLGAADLLRRAMGKKKPEEMAKQRSIFTEGAVARGVAADLATAIFDLMEKFAGYGFNKSHSAAYALIAYQTAWLKAHYPASFMAAALSAEMEHTEKLVPLLNECKNMRIEVLPPNLHASDYEFGVADQHKIRYGLGAIKGVGEAAIDAIIAERAKGGTYADLYDFCRRIDLRKANRRVLDALIRAGAIDEFGQTRSTLSAWLDSALKSAEQYARAEATGQNDLFGLTDVGAEDPDDRHDVRPSPLPEWPEERRLAGEKETLGLYLTGHPINRYREELDCLLSSRLHELRGQGRKSVTVGGLIVGMRWFNSRRGKSVAVTLDDDTARVEVTIFAEVLNKCQESVAMDRIVVVKGSCSFDEFSSQYGVLAEDVKDLEAARELRLKNLVLALDADAAQNGFILELKSLLAPYRKGGCAVAIDYSKGSARARLALGEDWNVRVPDELLDRLRERFGHQHVQLEY